MGRDIKGAVETVALVTILLCSCAVEFETPDEIRDSSTDDCFCGDEFDQVDVCYNQAGERITKSFTLDEDTATDTYAWDDFGMLGTVTGDAGTRDFTFDDAGKLLSLSPELPGEEITFDYDGADRLQEVSSGDTSVFYRYGPDNRRVRKIVVTPTDNVTVRYFSDGLVTYEISESGFLNRAIVYLPNGFTPLMLVTFSGSEIDQVYFYHTDHLSTPRALTDSTGTVIWQARYVACGFRYHGKTHRHSS